MQEYGRFESLSMDFITSFINKARLLKQPSEEFLLFPFELKQQALMSALLYIKLFEFCLSSGLECPWSGFVSHVIQQTGRDLMGANLDVRKQLTQPTNGDLSEQYWEQRRNWYRFCLVEMWGRLEGGLCWAEEEKAAEKKGQNGEE